MVSKVKIPATAKRKSSKTKARNLDALLNARVAKAEAAHWERERAKLDREAKARETEEQASQRRAHENKLRLVEDKRAELARERRQLELIAPRLKAFRDQGAEPLAKGDLRNVSGYEFDRDEHTGEIYGRRMAPQMAVLVERETEIKHAIKTLEYELEKLEVLAGTREPDDSRTFRVCCGPLREVKTRDGRLINDGQRVAAIDLFPDLVDQHLADGMIELA
jgi:signal recognition particle subunit SEC65